MEVGTEHDYYEFEKLLGEIPNVTSGDSHPVESVTMQYSRLAGIPLKEESGKSPSPSTNGYHASQARSPIRNYMDSVKSSQNTFDGRKNVLENGYHSPNKAAILESADLPVDQSMASALTQMNFEDRVNTGEMSTYHVNLKPKGMLLQEEKYQNHLKKLCTNTDTQNVPITSPQSPNNLKGSTMKKSNLSGVLGERKQGLPVYSGATPLAQSMYQLLPSNHNHVPAVDFSGVPYPQQYLLNTQTPTPYVQQQQISRSQIPWQSFNKDNYYRMQQQYYMQQFCDQVPQTHFPCQRNMNMTTRSLAGNARQPYQANDDHFWDNASFQVLDKMRRNTFPQKILTRSHGLNFLKVINVNSIRSNGLVSHNEKAFSNDHSRHQPLQFNSLDDVLGKIYLIAKDQNGCRFLQKKFVEGSAEDVDKIFIEIIGHIVELMTDPFGNYLVQKLLEVCTKDQKMQILHAITRKPGDLVRISLDMHGTRAVQKVIETLQTPEQYNLVVSSLKPGIVNLMKDTNGNHVSQRCLQHLLPEYKEFLFEDAITHCSRLAKDRHACCVLQKCLSLCDGEHRRRLVYEITSDALCLSQNQYGNYVVQFVFELHLPWATVSILDRLEGSYGYLSMQKYSSNVVEKCLKFAGDDRRSQIVQELVTDSRLDQILQDPYGNYVVQAALSHSKGASHVALVEAIKPHVPALRTSPYGKKILSSNGLKK